MYLCGIVERRTMLTRFKKFIFTSNMADIYVQKTGFIRTIFIPKGFNMSSPGFHLGETRGFGHKRNSTPIGVEPLRGSDLCFTLPWVAPTATHIESLRD